MPQNIKLDDSKGTRSYQRERTKEVRNLNNNFDVISISPPEFLTNEKSRELYTYLATQLNRTGYINNTDSSILLTLVINLQALKDAYKSLDEIGSVYTSGDLIKPNPAVGIITNTTAKIISASQQLGFSPSSRASLINLAQVDSEDSASQILEMFADE